MPNYDPVDDDVIDLVDEVTHRHHGRLISAGVSIEFVFASPSSGDGPALMVHGYPAAARVKINSQKDRAKGLKDAEITFDREDWDSRTIERRISLIDHELTHILVVMNLKANPVVPRVDNSGRPKLRLRPHDAQIGVFYECVERHGPESAEIEVYEPMRRRFTQLMFQWEPPIPATPQEPALAAT